MINKISICIIIDIHIDIKTLISIGIILQYYLFLYLHQC